MNSNIMSAEPLVLRIPQSSKCSFNLSVGDSKIEAFVGATELQPIDVKLMSPNELHKNDEKSSEIASETKVESLVKVAPNVKETNEVPMFKWYGDHEMSDKELSDLETFVTKHVYAIWSKLHEHPEYGCEQMYEMITRYIVDNISFNRYHLTTSLMDAINSYLMYMTSNKYIPKLRESLKI